MRSVVDTVVDGIITIRENGAVETLNPAAEQLFGYKSDEVIGQNVKLLMPEPYRHEHDNYIANYLRTGEAKIIGTGREVMGRRKDGSTFPMELAVSEFTLGGRRYFTGIVRNITERKKAEEALIDADRRKNEFLATLAHELRNRSPRSQLHSNPFGQGPPDLTSSGVGT
jgi:PAS domain S-box-containing protein